MSLAVFAVMAALLRPPTTPSRSRAPRCQKFATSADEPQRHDTGAIFAQGLHRAPPTLAKHVLRQQPAAILLDTPALLAAAESMEAITGIPPAAVEELWRQGGADDMRWDGLPIARHRACEAVLAWASIERGSDLFVAGKFNIPHVHEELLGHICAHERPLGTRARAADPRAIGKQPTLADMLLTPSDIQAAAYFPAVLEACVLGDLPLSPASTRGPFRRLVRILGHRAGTLHQPCQHLLRYRVWWDDPDRINYLDELEAALYTLDRATADLTKFPAVADRDLRSCPGGAELLHWAEGFDPWRLIADDSAPIPDYSDVAVLSELDAERERLHSLRDFKLGPKTYAALKELGVRLYEGCSGKSELLLETLTPSQQEELQQRLPRAIVGQLKRSGGLAALVQRARAVRDERDERDEKVRAQLWESSSSLFPERVSQLRARYARLLEAEELATAVWRDDRVALTPERLLNRLRRMREAIELAANPEQQFLHLNASLGDGPVGSDGLQLVVLRSTRQVWRTGKALKNCASMYSHRVQAGKYVLVALTHAKNATPVALGGYAVGSSQWEQARLCCPAAPAPAPSLCCGPRRGHCAVSLAGRGHVQPTPGRGDAGSIQGLPADAAHFLRRAAAARANEIPRGLASDRTAAPPATGKPRPSAWHGTSPCIAAQLARRFARVVHWDA